MTGEFTHYCTRYYRLTELLIEQNGLLNSLLDNAPPPYSGQGNIAELDNILSCARKVQAAKAAADKTFKERTKIKHTILEIMQHLELPPDTLLIGEIPGELEYELWANGNDDLFIGKIRNLPPPPDDPNVIMIKCSSYVKGR